MNLKYLDYLAEMRKFPRNLDVRGGNWRGNHSPRGPAENRIRKEKCVTRDIFFALILLRVVLCEFSPLHNCQLIHMAH